MRKITLKLTNGIQAILKLWGASFLKKLIWESEFKSGRWNYIDNTTEDIIYHHLEKYSKNGSFLDLGCGAGNTGNEMDVNKYKYYTGVDISEVAIRKAIIRSTENQRNDKNKYLQADIANYVPREKYNIILLRESINYTPKSRVKGLLEMYSAYLEDNGVFIVRMSDREKYGAIVRIIEESFIVVEKYLADHTRAIIIVFRPLESARQ